MAAAMLLSPQRTGSGGLATSPRPQQPQAQPTDENAMLMSPCPPTNKDISAQLAQPQKSKIPGRPVAGTPMEVAMADRTNA